MLITPAGRTGRVDSRWDWYRRSGSSLFSPLACLAGRRRRRRRGRICGAAFDPLAVRDELSPSPPLRRRRRLGPPRAGEFVSSLSCLPRCGRRRSPPSFPTSVGEGGSRGSLGRLEVALAPCRLFLARPLVAILLGCRVAIGFVALAVLVRVTQPFRLSRPCRNDAPFPSLCPQDAITAPEVALPPSPVVRSPASLALSALSGHKVGG